MKSEGDMMKSEGDMPPTDPCTLVPAKHRRRAPVIGAAEDGRRPLLRTVVSAGARHRYRRVRTCLRAHVACCGYGVVLVMVGGCGGPVAPRHVCCERRRHRLWWSYAGYVYLRVVNDKIRR